MPSLHATVHSCLLHLGRSRLWKINPSCQGVFSLLRERQGLIGVTRLVLATPTFLYQLQKSALDQGIQGDAQMILADLSIFEFFKMIGATSSSRKLFHLSIETHKVLPQKDALDGA